MRRKQFLAFLFVMVLTICTVLSPFSVSAYTPDKQTQASITSKAAIVVYLDSGASAEKGTTGRDIIIYEQDKDRQLSPAAMMRVAVGLYARKLIEEKKIDMNTATGMYTEALQDKYVWGTGLSLANMNIGEKWTIKDLMSLSMIQTAADACVTLTATLAGSVDSFLLGMNEYVKSIGCKNTTFSNVTGLDDIKQKTTPYDMYIIMRYALDDPILSKMLGALETTIKPVSGGEVRSWENTNYMLRASSDYYYDPLQLGKTGVSEDSGKALASMASLDGYRYITVVMGCPEEDKDGDAGTHYETTRALLNWVFNKFEYVNMVAESQPMTRQEIRLAWSMDSITLVAENPLSCLVPQGLDTKTVRTEITLNQEDLKAPIKKGEVLGKATLFIRENEKIGEVNLVAEESVKRSTLLFVLDLCRRVITSPWLWVTIVLLVVLIGAYIVLSIRYNRKRKRNARAKKKYKSLK